MLTVLYLQMQFHCSNEDTNQYLPKEKIPGCLFKRYVEILLRFHYVDMIDQIFGCVTDSVYPQLCPSWPYSPAAVPVVSVLWWSDSRSCLPLFSRKRNFLMGVLSWSSSSCIEILGAFSWTSESVSLHKKCRWWGSSQSFKIHLLGTYLCSKHSAEHRGCYGDQDGNCFCFHGLLFLNKSHAWRGSYSSTW